MEHSAGANQPYITLNNGLKMPQIGLGTANGDKEGTLHQVIKAAILEQGYRHIDTAFIYNNQEILGKAMKECFEQGVKREDLFVTSKLWRNQYSDIEGALKTCLEQLQLEYLDLYLIHFCWPFSDYKTDVIQGPPLHEVWRTLEGLVKKGLVRSIGISNANVQTLLYFLSFAEIKPAVNQVELHPYLVQADLVRAHEKYGVQVVAYAPLGAASWQAKREQDKKLSLFTEQVVLELAQKYGKTPAQIVLNWHIKHRKQVAIPKTMKVERLKENFVVWDFAMEEQEYQQVSALDRRARFYDPLLWDSMDNLPYFE